MSAEFSPQISISKRIFAGLLAVWMSGVAFLFCCGTINAQAADVEICPLSKKSHCPKSLVNKEALRIEVLQSDISEIDCCAFLQQVFNKIKKTETSQQIAGIPAKLEAKHSPVVFIAFKLGTFFDYRPHLLNRGDTYLKNQVFRI